MPGRHKGGCSPGCDKSCGQECWCHNKSAVAVKKGPRARAAKAGAELGLKAAVVRLRTALDAAKAFIASVKRDIEATAEELEGMIGGND